MSCVKEKYLNEVLTDTAIGGWLKCAVHDIQNSKSCNKNKINFSTAPNCIKHFHWLIRDIQANQV